MKLYRFILILLAILFVLPSAPESHAQSSQPLIILSSSDLWVVDGKSISNVTNDGHILEAVLSPDGTKIAYVNWSPISVDAVERTGGIGGGPLPADITVLDIVTRQITTIASQPADASFFVDGVPDNAILRSRPAWAPDGTRLVWGEVHYPSWAPETNRLVVYDFSTGSTTVLVTNLPEQGGVPMPLAPQWGDPGISIASYEYDTLSSRIVTRIIDYHDQSGAMYASVTYPENVAAPDFGSYVWVDYNTIMVQVMPSGSWEVLNAINGIRHPTAARPELYNPLAPESAALRFQYLPDAEWPNFYSWVISYPNGQQVAGQQPISDPSRATLGPDGQTVALVNTDGLVLIVSPDGKVKEGPILEDPFATLFWGPTAWRMYAPASCGDALPPRLIVGNWAALRADTTPNNLRETPATGPVLTQIQPGDDVQVLDGPECVNSMYWWQVDYQGTVGWTAEGDSSEYWLEPTIG